MAGRKIRFIEPRSKPGRPFNAWITRWPLLGPITLATILERRGYDVGVINENISGALEDNSRAWDDVCSADVVGISIMTPTASRGYDIARRVRLRAPHATIVFGGVHASFLPGEAMQHGDVVVRGEGETVIEDIASGAIVRGIVKAPPLEDLDVIPPLNHFLLRDFDRMLKTFPSRSHYELPVMTSRGCPYGCTYCAVTRMFGRRVRRQSVEKVTSDVRTYLERGFPFFFFYDDNFTSDRRWTRQLLERLAPMDVRFNTQSRIDFHWLDASRTRRDDALLRAMRRAGANVLYIGYETIEDASAAEWSKGYRGASTLESRLAEDTKILHDYGLWTHAMFVLGPKHTRKTAEAIIRFGHRCRIETLQVSILTPFPGTPLFNEMRGDLVFDRFPGDWDYFDGAHCVYRNAQMDIETFQRTTLNLHSRFYHCGSWYARILNALARRRISTQEKVARMLVSLRRSKSIFSRWQSETEEFLAEYRRRLAAPKTPLGPEFDGTPVFLEDERRRSGVGFRGAQI